VKSLMSSKLPPLKRCAMVMFAYRSYSLVVSRRSGRLAQLAVSQIVVSQFTGDFRHMQARCASANLFHLFQLLSVETQ